MDEVRIDRNSKTSRVEPIFGGLVQHSGQDWPSDLLRLAEGITVDNDPGKLLQATFLDEIKVPPTPQRLAWMIRNAPLLAPSDGRLYLEYERRLSAHPQVGAVLARLDEGDTSRIPPKLTFEGDTCCDCLIECEKLIIWIEGKRNDWLSPGTKWDVSRDQLARNLEAAWSVAHKKNKDFRLIVCYERRLKHHERCLIDGYRSGSWSAGLPHLDEETRALFAERIGTLRWSQIADRWPVLREASALQDLD